MGEALKSSTFYAPSPNANGEEEKLQGCLMIYPKGWNTEYKGYVSLFLSLVQCNKTEVLAKYKFSILNVEQMEAHTEGKDRNLIFGWNDCYKCRVGNCEFCPRSMAKNLWIHKVH